VRLVEVTIPVGEQELVVDTLESQGIDYYLTDETSGRSGAADYAAIITFPLPSNAVQPVIDDLRAAGLSEDAHVVILDAEVDTSRRFERFSKQYAAESGRRFRIAREEILIRSRELSPRFPTFVLMTVISAVVAAAGLLLDSPAVVVGSMVIAPLVGPALSASVGTVLDDAELFRRGVKLQVVGLVLAVVGATAFAVVVRAIPLFPPGIDITTIEEISGRISPDFLSLIIALGAGVAGVLSLAAGVSAALVGVMIAAALIPPAAAVGIGIAWGEPFVAVSAAVLVLINVLSINLSALLTLQYMGYRPKNWLKLEQSRSATLKRVGLLLVAIAVLSVFLGGVTYSSVQDARFTRDVRQSTDSVLSRPQYVGAERLDVEVRYGSPLPLPRDVGGQEVPFHRPRRVTVTVGVPGDRQYADLAEALRTRIRERTGHDVTVQVQYVGLDESG
jgi:uncharacterized hydrophobic protein (TIGR00341 family)